MSEELSLTGCLLNKINYTVCKTYLYFCQFYKHLYQVQCEFNTFQIKPIKIVPVSCLTAPLAFIL